MNLTDFIETRFDIANATMDLAQIIAGTLGTPYHLTLCYIDRRIAQHARTPANYKAMAYEVLQEINDDLEGCPKWLKDQIEGV